MAGSILCSALALSALAAGVQETPAAAKTPVLVRIGLAPNTWQGLNRNDAAAAITAWAKIIMRQRGIPIEVEINLFESMEGLRDSLTQGRTDAVSMAVDQFLALGPGLQPDHIYLLAKNHAFTERYVLLVHRDSGIRQLADLRGRTLQVPSNARTTLALPWLDLIMARQSLEPVEKVFGDISRTEKASKAVLQVFFRKTDAALVTAAVYEIACELNPQLHRDLVVIASSPEVVPSVFFFRPGLAFRFQEELEKAIIHAHEAPAGLEVLTVFQGDSMTRQPLACLESARQIIAERARLRGSSGAIAGSPATLSTP